jgi:NO-binding membrane sensor protein with MHYT domain
MHFIGMLAFVLPTAGDLSLLDHAGVGRPGRARQCRGAPHHEPGTITWWRLQLGSLALALAIGTMHYIGMEALTVDATMHYEPGMFALSIGVAYLLSMWRCTGASWRTGTACPSCTAWSAPR